MGSGEPTQPAYLAPLEGGFPKEVLEPKLQGGEWISGALFVHLQYLPYQAH